MPETIPSSEDRRRIRSAGCVALRGSDRVGPTRMKHARQEVWTSAEVSRLLSLLGAERDYLARVLDALPVPVAVLSQSLTIAMGNDAFWSVLGTGPETALGRHIEEVTGDSGAGSAIRQAVASRSGAVDFTSHRAGALPPFVVAALAGTDEFVLAGRSGPAAATRLHDPEAEQLRAAFLNSPDAQAIVDAAGAITFVNRAASSLGLSPGANLRDLLPPDHGGEVNAADLDGAQRPLKLADGRQSTVTVIARPLGAGATLLILRETGERRRIEEQERFLDRMDAVSTLAGGVSHQLNNILTVISSYCHMALDVAAEGGNPSSDIEAILKAGGDATQLGNQLIAIGRRHVVEEGPTDLNEVLLGLERTIRGICGDAVRVSITTEARLPAVPVDARQLERAILAIVLHAREAMAEGGAITLTTGLADNRVTLEIADTRSWPDEGISIRIFEPYAAWPKARKHSGLELAVAWCILQQRGGEVSLARSGANTVVRIAFAARARVNGQLWASEPEPSHSQVEPASAPSPGTVLLVDDNGEIRRAIRHMLEREAWHVIDVGHPMQALRALEQLSNPIDVLVSDVNMPDMNGRELAQRARELRPGLRVLMISGYADEEIIIGQLFEEGVMFLQKPFSPDRLLKTMRNLVQQHGSKE